MSWAHTPQANTENVLLFCSVYILFLPYAIHANKGFSTPGTNMLEKYTEVPVNREEAGFISHSLFSAFVGGDLEYFRDEDRCEHSIPLPSAEKNAAKIVY